MANEYGKIIDTTYLSLDMAVGRGFIHRDYIAHVLRWSHVCKFLMEGHRYKTSHVLDVGCGRETPLPKMMFSMRMTHVGGSYTGVDFGPIKRPETISETTTKFNMTLMEKTDFIKAKFPRELYDVLTCFEMLEHVEPFHSYQTLKRMSGLLGTMGTAFISTPCYDMKAGAAANHVNEMSYAGLKLLIEAAGLEVVDTWGTFASQKDYKKLMTPGQKEVFDQLSEYYDTNLVSCLMAPMFPEQSRNVLWQLRAGPVVAPDKKKIDAMIGVEHSNSAEWATDLVKIAADSKKRK